MTIINNQIDDPKEMAKKLLDDSTEFLLIIPDAQDGAATWLINTEQRFVDIRNCARTIGGCETLADLG